MRVGVFGENLLEKIGLHLNLAPTPVAESLWGPAASAMLIAGIRTAILPNLARRSYTADELAAELGLAPQPTLLLLEGLVAQRHVRKARGRYEMPERSKRWLDPTSPTYMGEFIASHQDYWPWWSGLPEVVRTGRHFEMHARAEDDPYWEPYITGQFELARLSAPEVAAALKFSTPPKTLLDVAGAHGWFGAELCRKYPGLSSTVVDLPGSVAVGRKIVAGSGMSDRVHHHEGDALRDDLGGPYDGALCFNLIHHLTPDQVQLLFRRIHDVLTPGALFAVLDLFRPPAGRQPDGGSMLGLFFYLQSGTNTYTPDQLEDWLAATGFAPPRKVPIRRIPVQTLYVTHRVD